MKCPNCGANIYDDVNRCQYCGAYQKPMKPPVQSQPQPQPVQPQPVVVNVYDRPPEQTVHYVYHEPVSPKSRTVALLLCIFLGWCGAHKFYVGRSGVGALYLLTFGLCGIGWAVDTLAILFGGARDKQGRKLAW